jgi:predicted metal-dependent phosphoesterase TrpH
MLDLHLHSTFSDGTDTPEALVALGVRIGVRGMALTDHDNLGGIARFLQACRERRLTGLSGVELSGVTASGTLHILGLGVDPACDALQRALARVLAGREVRNQGILGRLQQLGFVLAWDEVVAQAGEDVVGRPHFAMVLLRRGYVASVREAFDRFLGRGKPAYVERYRLPPEEAIGLIRAAGGLPVVAHPHTWVPEDTALEPALAGLIALGLGGIEAYYPEYGPERQVAYLRLARKLGLVVTGGTDYHGAAKPQVSLGTGGGHFQVPDALLAPLLQAIPGRAGVVQP